MGNPIIGITTYQGKNEQGLPLTAIIRAYLDAIIQAGGVPLLIPSNLKIETLQSVCGRVDGILFTGGGDIAVDRYGGEENSRVYGVDLERDSVELSLVELIAKNNIPFLGICRGFQIFNVGLGGRLFSNIDDQMHGAIKHDYFPDFPRNHLAHGIQVDKKTQLEKILGETKLSVNSLHHQGVKDVPGSLRAVAFAPDGLVEAVEIPEMSFGIAVQWHPEWLTDQPVTRRLFRSFTEAASSKL